MNGVKCLIVAVVVAMSTMVSFAQSKPDQDFDAFVAQLNERCPIVHDDGWAILAFRSSGGDTTHVELAFPRLLNAFLPALTGNTQNVRRVWARQMNMFGDQWKEFVTLMLDARRTLVLDFMLDDEPPVATVTFLPEDFK